MVSKTNKFSSFSTVLKSINPIFLNVTLRLVPKPTSSCTEHVRLYLANFSVTSRGLWLHFLCEFFGLSPRTYSKSPYSRYTNVSNSALPTMSFLKQVPSSKFLIPFSTPNFISKPKFIFFLQAFHYITKF